MVSPCILSFLTLSVGCAIPAIIGVMSRFLQAPPEKVMSAPSLTIIESDVPPPWQQMLSDLITDPQELLSLLSLDARKKNRLAYAAAVQFPIKGPALVCLAHRAGRLGKTPFLRQLWPVARRRDRLR
jgi:hypothetical protein